MGQRVLSASWFVGGGPGDNPNLNPTDTGTGYFSVIFRFSFAYTLLINSIDGRKALPFTLL